MSQNYLLFEEAGQFKTGTILQDTGTSLQVELTTGKRVKVKQANVMLRFASPGPAEMLAEALQEAENIDIDFLWEVAPQEEFDYQLLVAEYYGENPSVVQQTAMLMRLHGMPVYFYRKGRGRYRPAQPDTLKVALAAIERKRLQGRGNPAAGRRAGSRPAAGAHRQPGARPAGGRRPPVRGLACTGSGLPADRSVARAAAAEGGGAAQCACRSRAALPALAFPDGDRFPGRAVAVSAAGARPSA